MAVGQEVQTKFVTSDQTAGVHHAENPAIQHAAAEAYQPAARGAEKPPAPKGESLMADFVYAGDKAIANSLGSETAFDRKSYPQTLDTSQQNLYG